MTGNKTINENRFRFGRNWKNYLNYLDESQVQNSIKSLNNMLEDVDLNNKTFLDIGSGSGLSSLAAVRLGAKVTSFDYDIHSVKASKGLKEKFGIENNWIIQQGSVLDKNFLTSLGKFDIVYSWGVLHHTGNMLQSFSNIESNMKKNGLLFIAIYNDQGYKSKLWKRIKLIYVKYPIFRPFMVFIFVIYFWGPKFIYDLLRLKPFKSWKEYKKRRGMSPYFDVIDWIGGYPFEYSKPEDVVKYFRLKNFTLYNLKTCGGKLGCNEFVFIKK